MSRADARNPTSPAPAKASTPSDLRNVVLVGPQGSGKTTLVEALLVAAGALQRPGTVSEGTTVTDHDESEVRHQRSMWLAVASLKHSGIKVNLLDTPGSPEFVGELRAGLRGADAALFVVSAVDGVDGATRLLWEECAAVGMPRAIVVTKLDLPRADFDETVAVCQRFLGGDRFSDPATAGVDTGILALALPLADDDGTAGGVIELLGQRVWDSTGGARTPAEAAPEHLEGIAAPRASLIEGIIAESEDETLMDRYLAGEELEADLLMGDLETAVARGSFYPVLPAASPRSVGVAEILDVITGGFPSPCEHELPTVTRVDGSPAGPLSCAVDGPLVAEVLKTTSDPYVGRLSLVRVFSGTLLPDMAVHVSGHFSARDPHGLPWHQDHDVDERIGALTAPLGKTQRPVSRCIAGDIATVAKLSRAETGDTLSTPQTPLLMQPWVLPEPLFPVAIRASARSDEDKLAVALARLVAEDPTLRLEVNRSTGQLVLWCLGESHAEVSRERLSHRSGVTVDSEPLRLPLRETFARSARGTGRHIKQSGGRGQYAVCTVEVEPLSSGAGLEFVDRIVGGVVPRAFIASVEKGIRTQMERGISGFPLVDLRVTLVDGKAHAVDSSDAAFQVAGALALEDAAQSAGVVLLEPVDAVTITVADEYVGAVLSDLSARRGRILGTDPDTAGRTIVRADVPEQELARYAVDLRSLSHGTGTFRRSYQRHAPMPTHISRRMLEPAAAS